MRVNRGLLFWGLALLTAGAVALAVQGGIIPRETAGDVWRLWPLILIGIGIAIIASRSPFAIVGTIVAAVVVGGVAGTFFASGPGGFNVCGSGELDESSRESGSFEGASASVSIDLNCGDLSMAVGAGSDWSLDARRSGGDEPRVSASGTSLEIDTPDRGFTAFRGERHAWDVTLPADVELEAQIGMNAATAALDLGGGTFGVLGLDANAGDISLDLSGAEVGDLRVDGNALSFDLTVDGSASINGRLEFNAASIDICIGPDADVSITVSGENITFSHNLDASGLERTGDTWRTAGGSGSAPIDLRVGGNATSLTVNPSGGC